MNDSRGFSTPPPEWQPISSFGQPTNDGVSMASFDDGTGQLVRFYEEPVRLEKLSIEKGEIVTERRLKVFIQKFGDKTAVVDTYAEQYHIQKFPRAYYDFKNQSVEKKGILLTDWDAPISDYKIKEMQLMGINYVHDLCHISESQMDVLGPEAGYIVARAKLDTQEVNAKDKAAELQGKFDEMRDRADRLERQLMEIIESKGSRNVEDEFARHAAAVEKPRRGRRRADS